MKKIFIGIATLFVVLVCGLYLFLSISKTDLVTNSLENVKSVEKDVEKEAEPAGAKEKLGNIDLGSRDMATPLNPVEHLTQETENKSRNMREALLLETKIEKSEIITGRQKYSLDQRHVDWLARVDAIMGDKLTSDLRQILKDNSLDLLYISNSLDEKYLNKEITYDDYKQLTADLMKCNQQELIEVVSGEDYKKLFDLDKEETNNVIDETITAIPDFEISNENTTQEMVVNNVNSDKLTKLKELYRVRELEYRNINSSLENGKIDKDQAIQSFDFVFQNYTNEARNLLTPQEFQLIFGSNSDAPNPN